MQKHAKIAIIGTGFVASSISFAMALNQPANEVVLIDVNKQKSIGESLDIRHGLPFIGQMSIYVGDYKDCANCNCIIITAGLNRGPRESRIDLGKKNLGIAKEITLYTEEVFSIDLFRVEKGLVPSNLPPTFFKPNPSLESSSFQFFFNTLVHPSFHFLLAIISSNHPRI